MKTWNTPGGQILVRLVPGRSNVFLLANAGRHLLIDSGAKFVRKQLFGQLDTLRVTSDSLAALILTHTHFDHSENAAQIKQRYRTRVVVHESEAALLQRGANPPIRGSVKFSKWLLRRVGNRVEVGHTVQPVKPDCLIEKTVDLTPLGFDAKIIHTPGHSPGSCSVIIENHIAVVGDAMFGLIPGSIFPPFAFDVPMLIQSWKTLLDTGCSIYLPAHGTENKRERVQKQYEKYALRINK